jgi:hypothetical protein
MQRFLLGPLHVTEGSLAAVSPHHAPTRVSFPYPGFPDRVRLECRVGRNASAAQVRYLPGSHDLE